MSPASEKFLADIRSADAEVRFAAWGRAGDADPEVIPSLGKLLVAEQPGVRKAADESLKRIVHGVGKQPGGARRAAVVQQLIALTADGQAGWTRTMALRHLSLIGGNETVPAAAKLLRNVELQEEAVSVWSAFRAPLPHKRSSARYPMSAMHSNLGCWQLWDTGRPKKPPTFAPARWSPRTWRSSWQD